MNGQMGIEEFFNLFSKERMDLVDVFYDEDVHFIDPMVNFKNRGQLRSYYEKLYQNVESIRFDFLAHIKEGDTHMAAWRMTLVAQKFNGGRPVVVDGISHVRFGGKEGKAVYHRDYFDMGAFVYEHVPVVSSLVRLVKKVMSGAH